MASASLDAKDCHGPVVRRIRRRKVVIYSGIYRAVPKQRYLHSVLSRVPASRRVKCMCIAAHCDD